ncbi:MAG: hypothetical protein QOE36_3163, partial [Gaiellaceae bacterium]|nr:hypothetical protein [Gaiellaceae bacterium]
ALFIGWELRSKRPMVDLRLFRRPAFTGAQIVAFTLSAAVFSMFLYLTLYFQNILGFSALRAGVLFLPTTALSFFAAPIAGKLSAQVPVRLLMGAGLALDGVALLLMRGITPHSHWTHLLPGMICLGTGVGLVNPPLASTAISVVEPRRAGMASGTNNTFRQVGIATGIAATGALFQHHVRGAVESALQAAHVAVDPGRLAKLASSGQIGQALHSLPPGARQPIATAATSAFVGALNQIFLAGAIVAFAGAALALLLIRGGDLAQTRGDAPAPAG